MSDLGTIAFDNSEKIDILIKENFNVSSTNENTPWYLENNATFNTYSNGKDILLDEIPNSVNWSTSSFLTTSELSSIYGLTSSDFYSGGGVKVDPSGVLHKFIKLKLQGIPGATITSGSITTYYSYYHIKNGVNLLQDSFQLNHGDGSSFAYSMYSNSGVANNVKILQDSNGGNWFFNFKNGIVFVPDPTKNSTMLNNVNENNLPYFTFVKYVGRKGIAKQLAVKNSTSDVSDAEANQIVVQTSDNTIHRYDGSNWVGIGGSGGGSSGGSSLLTLDDENIKIFEAGNKITVTTADFSNSERQTLTTPKELYVFKLKDNSGLPNSELVVDIQPDTLSDTSDNTFADSSGVGVKNYAYAYFNPHIKINNEHQSFKVKITIEIIDPGNQRFYAGLNGRFAKDDFFGSNKDVRSDNKNSFNYNLALTQYAGTSYVGEKTYESTIQGFNPPKLIDGVVEKFDPGTSMIYILFLLNHSSSSSGQITYIKSIEIESNQRMYQVYKEAVINDTTILNRSFINKDTIISRDRSINIFDSDIKTGPVTIDGYKNYNISKYDNLIFNGDIEIKNTGLNSLHYESLISHNLDERSFANKIRTISCGEYFVAFILNTGKVLTFGRNQFGELGNGNTGTDQNKPVEVSEANGYNKTNAIMVSCGRYYTAILLDTGKVLTFGHNGFGQLGNGTGTNDHSNSPVDVSGVNGYDGTNAVMVSCGDYHTAILLDTGKVLTFGKNEYGQLGDNTEVGKTTPVEVVSSSNGYNKTNAVMVSCGGEHTTILLDSGKVLTFGINSYGQLGNSTNFQSADANKSPLEVTSANGYNKTNAIMVSCGWRHTAILLNTGRVLTFGYNYYGQLGNGHTNSNYLPDRVTTANGYDETNAVMISCSIHNTAILLSSGKVLTFGRNQFGQLGNDLSGDANNSSSPVDVSGANGYDKTNAVIISCGWEHTAILLNTGKLLTFGRNQYGQLGNGDSSGSTKTSPVQVSTSLSGDGYFGDNAYYSADATKLKFNSKSGNITSDGILNLSANNVGIGTTEPTTDLDVNGAVQIRNHLYMRDMPSTDTSSTQRIIYFDRIDENGYVNIPDRTIIGEILFRINENDNYIPQNIPNFEDYCAIRGELSNNGSTLGGKIQGGLSFWTRPGENDDIKTRMLINHEGNTTLYGNLLITDENMGLTRENSSELTIKTGIKLLGYGDYHNKEDGKLNINSSEINIKKGDDLRKSYYNSLLSYNLSTRAFANRIKTISCGQFHTAILLNTGNVLTFGYNKYGQLGNSTNSGNSSPNNSPLEVTSANGYNGTNAIMVSCGLYHTAILLNTGKVLTFGYNFQGQLGISTNVGTVNVNNSPLEVSEVNGYDKTNAIMVSCGSYHTAILLNNGKVLTSGFNNYGQLGNTTNSGENNANSSLLEVTSANGYDKTNAVMVSCGMYHTAVLLNTGKVLTFGHNQFGQLGNTTNVDENPSVNNSPLEVTSANGYNGTNAIMVSCGSYHTAILLNNGKVLTFGRNNDGELGNGASNANANSSPLEVTSTSGYDRSNCVMVSCGNAHTAILLDNGKVLTFGYNVYGQLGNSNSGHGNNANTPVEVTNANGYDKKDAVMISCGGEHTTILLNTGKLLIFGRNQYGQLGSEEANTNANNSPLEVVSANGYDKTNAFYKEDLIIDLNFGDENMGLTKENSSELTIKTGISDKLLGYEDYYDGEDGKLIVNSSEINIKKDDLRKSYYNSLLSYNLSTRAFANRIKTISCGENYTAILLNTGKVLTFGYNKYGQLGNSTNSGNSNPNNSPLEVTSANGYDGTNAIMVSCYYRHTAILLNTGKVLTFGYNFQGQLGNSTNVGETNANSSPLEVTSANGYDKTNAIMVSCGSYHTAILLNNGKVLTSGFNRYGQLGNTTNSGYDNANSSLLEVRSANGYDKTNAIMVSCGWGHTAILLNNGKVLTFGNNYSGQLGNSTNSGETSVNNTPLKVTNANGYNGTNAVMISCGDNHTAILLKTGKVLTFGFNRDGQLGNITNFGVNPSMNNSPLEVSNANGYDKSNCVMVSCGTYHTAILLNTGKVLTFGKNEYGQLGNDLSGVNNNSNAPVEVTSANGYDGTNAVSIVGGNEHTVILLDTGKLLTFGNNQFGQLGDGTDVSNNSPVEVVSASRYDKTNAFYKEDLIIDLNFGDENMGLTKENSSELTIKTGVSDKLLGYEDYYDGEYGKLNINSSEINIKKDDLRKSYYNSLLSYNLSTRAFANRIKTISCGFNYTAILLNTGKVLTFGSNSFGQLGNGTNVRNNTPVKVTDPSGIYDGTNAIMVSCGEIHTAILLNTGKVLTFGYNSYGQLGNSLSGNNNNSNTPVEVSEANGYDKKNAIMVSCGQYYTAILLNTGKVLTFGRNEFGQLGNGNSGTNQNKPVEVTDPSGIYDGTNAVMVSCGWYHTAILLDSGKVLTFGYNEYGGLGNGTSNNGANGSPFEVINASGYDKTNAVMVSCGRRHTAILLNNGKVLTFGYNGFGQLGVGASNININSSPLEVSIANGYDKTNAVMISCGSDYISILLNNGKLLTFGYNGFGELGNGNSGTNQNKPVEVNSANGYDKTNTVMVSCGTYHTAILLNTGKVLTFGRNQFGELGNGNTGTNQNKPVEVSEANGYDKTNAFYKEDLIIDLNFEDENMGLTRENSSELTIKTGRSDKLLGYEDYYDGEDGKLIVIGDLELQNNGLYQSYYNSLLSYDLSTRAFANKIKTIGCGVSHTVILLNTGKVLTFGSNTYGQLGNPTNSGIYSGSGRVNFSPLEVSEVNGYDGTNAVMVSCGGDHAAILLNTGKVLTFGKNNYGQLGNSTNSGTDTANNSPLGVSEVNGYDGTNAVMVSCGTYHTAILLNTGKVLTFGKNNYGQLGNSTNSGTNTANNSPLGVSEVNGNGYDGTNAVMVSCGGDHTAILLNTGKVLTFGTNYYGQLGNSTNLANFNANNSPLGVSEVNGYNENAVVVSCGSEHTAILLNTGKVLTFGYNYYGQLGNGTSNNNANSSPLEVNGYDGTNAVMVNCGWGHTAILLNNGKVLTSGYNRYGQLGNSTNSGTYSANNSLLKVSEVNGYDGTNAVMVSCGWNHTAILLNNGKVLTLGYNYNGQLGNITNSGQPIANNSPLQVTSANGYNKTNVFYKKFNDITAGNATIGYIAEVNVGNITSNGTITIGDVTINNTPSSYGQIQITGGSTGGYEGIQFPGHSSRPTIMARTNDGITGLYYQAYSDWAWLCYANNGSPDIRLYYNGSEKLKTRSSGVYVTGTVTTGSDRRIKENIREVPDNLSLQKLRDINCVYYEYKDKEDRGDDSTIGFIAQQVREHIPIATDLITEIIPNEMRVLNDYSWSSILIDNSDNLIDNSNNLIVSNKYKLTIHDLSDNSGNQLYRFFVSDDPSGNNETKLEIKSLENDPKSFLFDQSWNYIFLYGKEVNDFHTLNKSKLFTLNFSATQEIDRIQQQEKTKVEALEIEVASLKTEITELKQLVQDLLNK